MATASLVNAAAPPIAVVAAAGSATDAAGPGSASVASAALAIATGATVAAVGLPPATDAGAAGAIEAAPIAAASWPAGVQTPGDNIETSLQFHDKHGANYVVMSSRDAIDGDPAAPGHAAYLYIDDWIVPPGGTPHSPLPIGDMVASCATAPIAKFHEAAFAITDLDHNGIAEITFAYELSCRKDTRPATYKLIMLENGTQYTLRGETRIESGGVLANPGGSFEPDPPAAKWPRGFLDHARQVWQRTADDLELPPRR